MSLARRRRGMSMTRLAELVGVKTRTVSAWEHAEYEPEDANVARLAEVLHFPKTFFFGSDLEEPRSDMASFRALTRMTAAQRDTALGAGAIAFLLNDWIEERFELPPANVPDLSRAGNPEAAADALRRIWGIGELPIKNAVHLLESRGVRVFSLSIDAAEVDAFSMWRTDTPFVFLNTKKSCEHSRFDAAHELGHLVLHRHGAPQGQKAEQEANAFASAFLMPRASVLANARRLASVPQLIELKKYWTVSVAALAYRLHAVGLVTDWHYRSLCIDIATRGYRKQEPNEAPREISQVLAKVFAALRAEGIGKEDIAHALHVPAREIDQLVFGLALTSLAGTDMPGKVTRRPALRIVERSGRK